MEAIAEGFFKTANDLSRKQNKQDEVDAFLSLYDRNKTIDRIRTALVIEPRTDYWQDVYGLIQKPIPLKGLPRGQDLTVLFWVFRRLSTSYKKQEIPALESNAYLSYIHFDFTFINSLLTIALDKWKPEISSASISILRFLDEQKCRKELATIIRKIEKSRSKYIKRNYAKIRSRWRFYAS